MTRLVTGKSALKISFVTSPNTRKLYACRLSHLTIKEMVCVGLLSAYTFFVSFCSNFLYFLSPFYFFCNTFVLLYLKCNYCCVFVEAT